MKSTLAVLALTLTFSSSVFSAELGNLRVQTHETLILKKISKKRFEKISDSATGIAEVNVSIGGKMRNVLSQAINDSNTDATISYEVTGKNILRIQDRKEGINKEVQAEIKKSIFGRVKAINIDSQTMDDLYADAIKKSGLGILKDLRILGGGALKSNITASDMSCKAEDDLLICEQDATLLMTVGK